MSEQNNQSYTKGNRFWSVIYSVKSLRTQWTRNVGIAILLAIGIAIPTTVFTWSTTAVHVALDDHFNSNAYQIQVKGNSMSDKSYLEDLSSIQDSYQYVERIDYVESTAGYVFEGNNTSWEYYNPEFWNAEKDCRIFPMSNELLDIWKGEFSWQGNDTLSSGEVLVSKYFTEIAEEIYGLKIELGTKLDFDVFTSSSVKGARWTREHLQPVRVYNLTVAGIYDVTRLRTLLANSFPSQMRVISLFASIPTIGTTDSVMIHVDDIGEEALDRIHNFGLLGGLFDPVSLVRSSVDELLAQGANNVEDNLLAVAAQIRERYPLLNIKYVVVLKDLGILIEVFLRGQMLTLLAVPVILMSMFITIFTSESSVARRQGEVSILRSRGASYNQITSSIMWESGFLTLAGLALGLVLTIVMAPLLGASTGFLLFDFATYLIFLGHLTIPYDAIWIALAISMYLPGVYLIHIQRKIDVGEIGQPVKSSVPEEAVESGFLSFTIGFFLLLALVIIVPSLIEPIGFTGATQILFVTLILFGASYLGSKMMQKIVARLSLSARSVLGERTLYIAQSLRRRKSKFIPLLIILTISLATTTMMLMESSSFETTIQNEIRYAIGADLRIECGEPKPLDFGEELKANGTILSVTPVIDAYSDIGEEKIVLLGVNALEYLEIAHFSPTSFVDEEPEAILTRLRDIHNGIVISDKYASSLNKTTGDDVYSIFASGETKVYRRLQIVGRMRSAPGFGFASSDDSAYETVGGQLGYQVLHDGFALVNNYYLMSEANRQNASLFLASAEIDSSFSEFCDNLEASYHVNVISPHYTLEVSSYLDISQFLSGIQGITVISAILCAAMAIASTGLFFGTAILERKPEYAIFRALGATRRQVASMVLGEFAGLVVSVIAVSVVLGLLFGQSMSVLVFSIAPLDLVLPEILSLPILVTVVILLIEWATMLAACLYPAQVAGSTKMVEELRNL